MHLKGTPRVNHFLLSPPLHLSLDTGEVLELALAGGKPRKTGLKAGFGSQVCSTPAVRVAPSGLELHKLQPLYRPPQLSSYHHNATNSRSPPRCVGSASQPRTSARAACPLELFFPTQPIPKLAQTLTEDCAAALGLVAVLCVALFLATRTTWRRKVVAIFSRDGEGVGTWRNRKKQNSAKENWQ